MATDCWTNGTGSLTRIEDEVDELHFAANLNEATQNAALDGVVNVLRETAHGL